MTAEHEPPKTFHLKNIAMPDPEGAAVHGSAVVFEGKGVLFFGPSGTGKSRAALAMMAYGADLVSDDRVIVAKGPVLRAPAGAPAMIEARGIGLLGADLQGGSVPFSLAVSLAHKEPDRLPPSRVFDCAHATVPLILGRGDPNFAPALIQYLRKGRSA